MLDELLDLFERDRKHGASRPAGGLRGRLGRLFGGGDSRNDDRPYAETRRYRDDDDDDDDGRRYAETRRYRDDDDDDDDDGRAYAGSRKRKREFFEFGDD